MANTFTDDNFDEEVLKSDKPVLVDFFAEWCGPCKMLAPIIDELAEEYKGKWKVGKVNIDEAHATAQKYGVQSIPTILVIKGGEVIDTAIGFQSKEALKMKMDS